MKMAYRDFLCLTLQEYLFAREQHQRLMVEYWRQTRLILHSLSFVYGDRKRIQKDVLKFMPLPFDEDFEKKSDNFDEEAFNKRNRDIIQSYKDKGFLK